MNFRQQIAKYVTGNIVTSQLPAVGIIGLEEGLDTPSLCILAGLGKNEWSFQIEHYFKLALDELGIQLPDRRHAALEYALAIVDDIVDGKTEIISGVREIRYNAIDSYDFFSETKEYCYDSIGFEYVFGLFDTYDELTHADRPWQDGKTNAQLMTEVKAELFIELQKWRDKLRSA